MSHPDSAQNDLIRSEINTDANTRQQIRNQLFGGYDSYRKMNLREIRKNLDNLEKEVKDLFADDAFQCGKYVPLDVAPFRKNDCKVCNKTYTYEARNENSDVDMCKKCYLRLCIL